MREELRELFDEVAEIDWSDPAWRTWLGVLAATEAWRDAELDPRAAVDAFETALRASSGPVADTFMATHGPPAPKDRAGRIELAVERAVEVARVLRDQDHTAPGQRLVKQLCRRGGWLEDRVLPREGGIGVALLADDRCLLASVNPDDPAASSKLRAQLTRALDTGAGLAVVDRDRAEPTAAAAAISLAPVSQTWARSFHRAAWTRGGGPWMGVADSPPYEHGPCWDRSRTGRPSMTRRTWIKTLIILGALSAIAPVASAQDDAEEGITIREVQIGTSLENGLVASPTTSISRTAGRIFAVIRLNNPSREATTIRVALEPVGATRGGFSLDIPGRPRYRTVARFGAQHPPGEYRIVIRTADGAELQSVAITITE